MENVITNDDRNGDAVLLLLLEPVPAVPSVVVAALADALEVLSDTEDDIETEDEDNGGSSFVVMFSWA